MNYIIIIAALLGFSFGYLLKVDEEKAKLRKLRKWLEGQMYLLEEDIDSDTMTEQYEKEHAWELSRNYILEKVIKKIEKL